jgi:hypothetical protein
VGEEGGAAAVGGGAEQPEVGIDEVVEEPHPARQRPDDKMYRLLDLAGPEQAGEVRQFLAELPEIAPAGSPLTAASRSQTHFAVATPLLAADAGLIAASSAATDDPAEADSLDDPGEELKKAIATPVPDTASAALNKLSSGRSIRLGTLTSVAAAGVYPNVAQEP